LDSGLSAGQADAESFDLAQPALLLCLSNAVNEVVADLDQIERDILESAS